MFEKIFIVYSEVETANLAAELSNQIKAGDVVALIGNLGSGKTFFVKKYCERLNIFNVTSPTFAIVNEYQNGNKIYHFDFYRINKLEELIELNINDYLIDDESIVFIEWADLFNKILPKKRIEIFFEVIDDDSRKIIFRKYE